MKRIFLICSVIAGSIMFSCESEKEYAAENNVVSDEVLQKIKSLDLNTNYVELSTLRLPGGAEKEVYLVENDIAISPSQLAEISIYDGITSEQYRTHNLVRANRTFQVIGFTGGSQALTSKMRTALEWAVANYNRLNTNIRLNLTFGTDYEPKDIVVYMEPGSAGGRAGFPSNGAPYKYVQIFSGTDSYNTDVIEHIITHEIGHCFGLRHTDWFSRQSCGQGGGEPAEPSGAVHIPGTPTGYDSGSIMKACFNGRENGEFGRNDITALEYLY